MKNGICPVIKGIWSVHEECKRNGMDNAPYVMHCHSCVSCEKWNATLDDAFMLDEWKEIHLGALVQQ